MHALTTAPRAIEGAGGGELPPHQRSGGDDIGSALEHTLAEIMHSARLTAPELRFAVIPAERLTVDRSTAPIVRAWRRCQAHLRRTSRIWAGRVDPADLRGQLMAIADACESSGRNELAASARGVATAAPADFLALALAFDRSAPKLRDIEAARRFSQAFARALALLPRPTTLEQLDVASAQQAAREAFALWQLPLVRRLARAVARRSPVPREDLAQEGCVALLRAADRFDPRFGVPFPAYAHRWLKQHMRRVERSWAPVALPHRLHAAQGRVRHALSAVAPEGDLPSNDRIARELRMPVSAVAAIARTDIAVLSLEADGQVEVADDRQPPPEADMTAGDRRLAVRRALAGCGQRERDVLRLLFGIDAPACSIPEAASRLGISSQRVAQIRAVALRRLRRPAVSRYLAEYA